jgi:ankyrin repeat protein
MGNYGSKSSIIDNVIDNVMNTNNFKLNKIIHNRYNTNFLNEIDKTLVDFNINTCDKEGKNLLHIFASSCNIRILQILVDHGCDINKKDNFGNTPVFYSSENTIEFFINNGADLNIKNNEGYTVLYKKSRYYFTSSVKILFNAQNCEDVYEQFEKYELLHKAVLFQDIPKMKEIMNQNKFLVNSSIEDPIMWGTKQLLTPLSITCRNGLYEEFLCLLEHGADIPQNNLLINMSFWNINKNQINIIIKLIELGNDIDDQGENVLHKLYSSKCVELVEIFLKAGVDVHAKTLPKTFPDPVYIRYCHLVSSNETPLQCLSAFNNNIEVYQKLFEYGADPNVQNNYGITAFMGICSNEFFRYNDNGLEIIKLFVENGTNIYLTDNFGNNSLDILCNNPYFTNENKIKIIKYLQEKFNFIIVKPKTNELLYETLVKDKLPKDNKN